MLRILVSAYACEPGKGSEPEVGWQWVRQIARFHETWVITRSNNKLFIEKGDMGDPNPNLHFIYVDLPPWMRFWKKGNRGIHLYYHVWQVMSGLKGRRLHEMIGFDVVHHVTFVNDWVGSGMSMVPAPLVWGPIGSHPFVPRRYLDFIGCREYGRGILRLLMRLSARYRDPLYRLCAGRSRQIIVANRECISRLPGPAKQRARVWAQNAFTLNDLGHAREYSAPLRVLSVGRLIGFKGFRLALKGFAKHLLRFPDSTLTLLGDGEQRRDLEALVTKLGIRKSVAFLGNVPRTSVLESMAASHVFLFPSFEGAGMVVIEAMAKGLPVVCLDFGGPGEYVTDECGIKVGLTEPAQVVDGLADALSRLAADQELYERLSIGAIRRVRENYLWDRIGDRLNTLYLEVHEEIGNKAGDLHGRQS